MEYKRLYIWVEGSDDERFFSNVVKQLFVGQYDYVAIVQYAKESLKWQRDFIDSIKAMNADYIFTGDLDSASCITERKISIQNKLNNIDTNCLLIIIKEIEGWYLAGLNDQRCIELGLDVYRDTNAITKEDFYKLMSTGFGSKIDFMWEIIKVFSINEAKQKNFSFKYFAEKYRL